jgi:quaternary ammonium compound-resistance protein SugE
MSRYVPSIAAAWTLIVVSGAFEIVFSVLLKESDGFTRPVPTATGIAAALLSIWVMTIALRTLPLGPSYAVWAGIGTLGTAIAAMILYSESMTLLKGTFMLLIVVGIVGLQLQGRA